MDQLFTIISTIVSSGIVVGIVYGVKKLLVVLKGKGIVVDGRLVEEGIKVAADIYAEFGGNKKLELATKYVADKLGQKGLNVKPQELEGIVNEIYSQVKGQLVQSQETIAAVDAVSQPIVENVVKDATPIIDPIAPISFEVQS